MLLDLDDTLFDSPMMLGSKAWRKYIAQAAPKNDITLNWHDYFSYLLAQRYPTKAIEEITSEFVKELQNRGYIVCGFTARERKIWYETAQPGVDLTTIEQLHKIDIDLDNGSLELFYPELAEDSEYYLGVFFVNTETKGNYFLHLLENATKFPPKVIFIDDKKANVESMDETLDKLGIPHECYLYAATDSKTLSFNPKIANIQLYYFMKSTGVEILTDQQADDLLKTNPDRDFLQDVIGDIMPLSI